MKQDISLWSPVVIASLAAPRFCRQERHYPVGPLYKRVEDIKVRIRNISTEPQGRSLETRMTLEIIILLEDYDGRAALVSRPETIKERLDWGEFDHLPQATEGEVGYITRIRELKWDGTLQNNEIIIEYCLSYVILAVREEIVRLYATDDIERPGLQQRQDTQAGKPEVPEADSMNKDLLKRLFLYERDMASLQRAIKKAEERNASLNRELNGTQQLVQKLQDAVIRKDLLISHYKEHPGSIAKQTKPHLPVSIAELNIGQRLKRMFMNSL